MPFVGLRIARAKPSATRASSRNKLTRNRRTHCIAL
jgi:hypothetical protein